MGHKGDSLGDRMKTYENVTRNYLTRRIPAIIRIDGKAFHTFTKGFNKPFDDILSRAMQETMQYLCENIQGCVLGYTQSDEISLLLTDYTDIRTEGWFNYNIQKMVSIAASMATLKFDARFHRACLDIIGWPGVIGQEAANKTPHFKRLGQAMFDARVFSIPKEEVCNYFIWRQQDATRNSIEMVGRAYFSHKQLHKKTCSNIQDMLMLEKGVNWNDIPTVYKRGCCCVKKEIEQTQSDPNNEQDVTVKRNKWEIDLEIPIFTQDRNYVESRI